jgi:hypothetical protein
MVQKALREVSVTHRVNSGYDNLVELLTNRFVGGDFLFPAGPVFLLLINKVIVDRVAVGEHRLDISQNVVDFASASLVDGGAYRPNQAEDEPLLNVKEEIASILLLALFKAKDQRVKQITEALDTGNF